MKAKLSKKPVKFEPVTLIITFESQQELDDFKETIEDSDYLSIDKRKMIASELK